MKPHLKFLMIVAGIIAALLTPLVQAETGSDGLFDTKIAQLQHEIGLRNQLSDQLVQFQLAHGYSSPEALDRGGNFMLAHADDDAFTKEMRNLQQTIGLFDLIARAS